MAAVEEHGEHVSHWGAFKQALKDPKTYVFMLIYNVLNSLGTISYFFPTLMAALGYHGRMQQFMTVPIYAVALVISLTGGFIADKTGQKALVVAGGCLLAIISFVIIAAVPNDKVKYAFLCFGGGGIWTAVPVTLSWVVTMFDGKEKRAVCIALINGESSLRGHSGPEGQRLKLHDKAKRKEEHSLTLVRRLRKPVLRLRLILLAILERATFRARFLADVLSGPLRPDLGRIREVALRRQGRREDVVRALRLVSRIIVHGFRGTTAADIDCIRKGNKER